MHATTTERTSVQAFHAIRAAENAHIWGRFAARRYCERRGVPLRLYYLAKRLEARAKVDEELSILLRPQAE